MKSGKLFAMLTGLLLLSPALGWAETSTSADDWGGLYIGANAGWVGSAPHTQATTTVDPAGYFNVPSDASDVNDLGDQHPTSDNFTGGGQIGYNWQSGQWVVGVETDFGALNTISTTGESRPYVSVPSSTLTLYSTTKTDWLWTLRPRIGFAMDDWLIYGTGGMTVADLEVDFNLSDDNSSASEHQNISATKVGWTVGGGAEMRLDKNWSIRGEYLYADLGTLEADANDMTNTAGVPSNTLHHKAEFTMHLARVSLNYKF